MKQLNGPKTRLRRDVPKPDLIVAYLSYAVEDVRALSTRSTVLLESAIAALVEETRSGGGLTRQHSQKMS
jgi:hypothetical protein